MAARSSLGKPRTVASFYNDINIFAIKNQQKEVAHTTENVLPNQSSSNHLVEYITCRAGGVYDGKSCIDVRQRAGGWR